MAMVDAKVNFNFEEVEVDKNQVLVTNNLGRTAVHKELVYLDGYIGEVTDFDGIVNGETGYINIDPNRKIGTTQINVTDTFVLGGVVHLVSHATVATSVLRDAAVADSVPVGICTKVNNGVSVEFLPFVQRAGGGQTMKFSVYHMDSDHSTLVPVTGLVPLGAKIYDVFVEATVTSGSGTMQLRSNAGSPADITAAIICAVDNVVTRQAILTNDIVDADGLEIISAGTNDRGIMTIMWR